MKIQCQNCGVEHEIAPPSWVVSSGRAFRFRCSSCGYSQSVHPSTLSGEPEPVGETPPITASLPSFPNTPVEPAIFEEPEPESDEVVDAPESDEPPGEFDQPITHSVDDATPSSGGEASAVFLKQNGQIYMVSDWETLKRWIAESRVERHDLVSEGGVRWEPVGNRPELMPAFGGTPPVNQPFPFGGETPFGAGGTSGALGWHDDDTEGVPTGLPPLPTDEVPRSDARGFDALDARLRKMTPTPPPVARRAPPPQRPGFLSPSPVLSIDPDEIHTEAEDPGPHDADSSVTPLIAPPALPDTVPPAPMRATPSSAPSDPDQAPTQPAAFPRDAMKPRAFRMADEHDEFDEVSELHELPPLPPEMYESDDEEVVVGRRSNTVMYLVGAVALLLFFLVVFLASFALTHTPAPVETPPPLPLRPVPTVPAPVPDVPSLSPAIPAPVVPAPVEPPPSPVEPPPTPVEPRPTEPRPATPRPVERPTPRPDPTPVPPRPRLSKPGVTTLIDRGWAQVEGNARGAVVSFRSAVEQAPNNADANFGYGYALVKTGRAADAKTYLCKAASKGSLDTRREAQGTLAQANLSCE